MKVDIIIRAKDGRELLDDAVRSIVENTPKEKYRLILVDDGSDPPLDYNGSLAIRHPEPMGSVTAINSGLALSLNFHDSDYVMICDNDIEVPFGDNTWLERFVQELEEVPGTGAVGATTDNANPPQHVLVVPQTYTADWKDPQGRHGEKENPYSPWFVSFCVLFKKEVIRKVGMWDERYNPGNYEDTDYGVQMRRAGYEIRVARSVYIHHKCHSTFGTDLKQLLRTNHQKFVQKWGPGALADLGCIEIKEAFDIYKACGVID